MDRHEKRTEQDFGPDVRGEEPSDDLVVLLDAQPVGLLQRSRSAMTPRKSSGSRHWSTSHLAPIELDYLIADPARRGRGPGTQLIETAVARTWIDHPCAPAVLVAVVPANTASWRALQKAGLRRIGETPMTPDNPIDDPLRYIYHIDRSA
jgi:aminoglycoside 6'-N-acetyltransferase